MEREKLNHSETQIALQVVRDILVEHGLTTREEFKEKYYKKIDVNDIFTEEEKNEMKKLF